LKVSGEKDRASPERLPRHRGNEGKVRLRARRLRVLPEEMRAGDVDDRKVTYRNVRANEMAVARNKNAAYAASRRHGVVRTYERVTRTPRNDE